MTLSDIKSKYYPEIDETLFWDIVRVDPTYNPERPEKRGRYTTWLLTLYRQNNLKEEDYSDATEYLTAFESYKQRMEIKDIGRYHTLPDLYDKVNPYLGTQLVTRNTVKHEEATKVYEDQEWTVVVPHTWEAAKLYGANTRWCTASTHTSVWYNNYTRDGDLYININRKCGRKYQMLALRDGNKYAYCYDESDRLVDSGKIGLSVGAVEFYNRHFQFDPTVTNGQKLAPNLYLAQTDIEHRAMVSMVDGSYRRVLEGYSFVRFDKAGETMLRCVEDSLGRCLIDLETFEVIPVKECDFCNEFSGNYAVAWKNNKIGVLDRTGRFHSGTEHLQDTVDLSWGIAPVGINKKEYNFIDKHGDVVFNENFKWCGKFSDGYCRVVFHNGEKGYVSADKTEWVLPKEIQTCFDFQGKVAKVYMADGMNLLHKDGHYVFEKCVREIFSNSDTSVNRIQLTNGHFTFYDTWTGLFTDMEFLDCRNFVMGLAAVKTADGQWNFLQADGTLLLNRGVDWCTDFDRETGLAKISTYRGENFINTAGEVLKPWPKLKQKKRLPKGTRFV